MNYSLEDCKVILCAGTDHEVVIEGLASIEEISFNKERLWHKLLRVEGDRTHVVEIWDNNYHYSFANLTEEGYNKHIKDLKPSAESPFKFTVRENN